MTTLRNLGVWMKRHFDFALILAALVEIPRWTVTFLAIHEPLWVGIPLGALLAYATSEGWRAYFANPTRVKLLCFNIASLAAATFVITPVLFSMASAPIDEIDLSALLPQWWLLAWSSVLAVTTFAPLIQLAAVKSTPAAKSQETPQNVAARSSSAVSAEQTIVGVPVGTLVAQNAVDIASQPAPESPEQPQPATPKPAPVLRKVGKPGKTNEFGMTDTALAELLGVARQRIEPMRKSGTLMARVARDLPQLAAPHTNGFNHSAQ